VRHGDADAAQRGDGSRRQRAEQEGERQPEPPEHRGADCADRQGKREALQVSARRDWRRQTPYATTRRPRRTAVWPFFSRRVGITSMQSS
jgi:hypothetical protein